jgi:DNA (cytosine-5)-methyltransferase 1
MFDVRDSDADAGSLSSEVSDSRGRFVVASLFAGIGGFDIAFEASGSKIAVQCEIDPFCRAVLTRHWPAATLIDDITSIDPQALSQTNLWTAGFPCQDVSLARGNHGRSGLKGDHTSLFFKLVELLEVCAPEVLVLENVVGLLNSHKGCDFAIILRELTKHGYAVAWRVLNARYFGTPQSRSRVFMVAWKNDYKKALRSLFESEPGARVGTARSGFVTPTTHRTGAVVPEVAYCVAATSGRHTGNDWARSYISYSNRVRRPTASESERLQGFEAGWTIPVPGYREPIRGLDSERYRAVGNAVAVPVVKWVASRISKVARERSSASKAAFEKHALILAPDLRRDAESLRFTDIMSEVDDGTFAYRWKGCGIAFGDIILEGATAPAPSVAISSRFVDLLDQHVPDDRYFLTANAAVGILRRADVVGRTLFAPMRAALEEMVEAKAPPAGSAKKGGNRLAKTSICPPRAEQRGNSKRISAGSSRAVSNPC